MLKSSIEYAKVVLRTLLHYFVENDEYMRYNEEKSCEGGQVL